MEVRLEGLTVRIPYSSLLRSELYLLQNLHSCRLQKQPYFAEAKLSPRLTVITICYLLASLTHPIYYLCLTEARRMQLMHAAQVTISYFSKALTTPPPPPLVCSREPLDQTPCLIILTTGEYFSMVLRCKEERAEMDSSSLYLPPVSQQYVLIESNCLQDLVCSVFSVELNQIVLRRAIIQHRKLDRYYHSRTHTRSPAWDVPTIEKEFTQFYQAEKEILTQKSTNTYKTYKSKADPHGSHRRCLLLINLSNIGYLLASLLTEEKEKKDKKQTDHHPCSEYLNDLDNILMLPRRDVKQFRKFLLELLALEVPRININKVLSSDYILKVCTFFEKIIVWQEILTDTHPNALQIVRQKQAEGYELKSLCFEQKVLLNLLGSRTYSVIQNLNLPREYFEEIFRWKSQGNYKYDCPFSLQQHTKITVKGLIVAITPSEEDLHLSEKEKIDETRPKDEKAKEDIEHHEQIIRAYGVLLHDLCEVVPDGVVVYFPSSQSLLDCRKQWEKKERIYERLNATKKIFEQSEYERQNVANVEKFKKYCDIGRGGIFLVSSQSPFCELQQFQGHYSRCVIFIGLPSNYKPGELSCKLSYLEMPKQQHRYEQSLKTVCKCLNNCISSAEEPKVVVFADSVYNKEEIKRKWFPFVTRGNLSSILAVENCSKIFQKTSKLVKYKSEWEKK